MRQWFEDRSFSFRNQGRTNLLLELMAAELEGKASVRNYSRRIGNYIVGQIPGLIPRHLIYHSPRLH